MWIRGNLGIVFAHNYIAALGIMLFLLASYFLRLLDQGHMFLEITTLSEYHREENYHCAFMPLTLKGQSLNNISIN